MSHQSDQLILRAFTNVYADILAQSDLHEQIQAVKGALRDRNYELAFSSQANLKAYIVRWSPARALAYEFIFRSYSCLDEKLQNNAGVLCIGGGAGAELAALSRFNVKSITTVDFGDWEPVVRPLIEQLGLQQVEMVHGDAITMATGLEKFDVITSLFVTNELFAENKAGAMVFFKRLAASCKKGTLLVIIESAGSYSEIQVGSKKFPIYFLVHHSLGENWSLVESEDSKWFRLNEDTAKLYPLELQNMRFFIRIYQRN